jgi:peptidyl-tRNA hydrolase ICT1
MHAFRGHVLDLVHSNHAMARCTRAEPAAVQRRLYSARSASVAADPEQLQAARTWLAKLHAEVIPLRALGELSFSRSSGPGGQNVNKYDKLQTSID